MAGAEVLRLAAFSEGDVGGNPAGVALLEAFPAAAEMLRIAAEVGYSETAFLFRDGDAWRTRYFAPAGEVSFCGHATIAAGAVLGERHGEGVYRLRLNDASITVEARRGPAGRWSAALQSPGTWSKPAGAAEAKALSELFGLAAADLDARLPVRLAHAGATHAVLGLASRQRLAAMAYPFEPGRTLMLAQGLTTISLVWPETERLFHSRNAFAFGGVYEDPATGAAAAALGGYLRDIGWADLARDGGEIEIRQGQDMGAPSRLSVTIGPVAGESVRVAGTTRIIAVA